MSTLPLFSVDLLRRERDPFIESLAQRLLQGETTLLDVAHAIQDKHGYLSREALEDLSFYAHLPRESLQSFISFYSNLSLKPTCPYKIKVCNSLSCYLNGSTKIFHEAQQLASQLGANKYSVQQVSCLGQCEKAPAILINNDIHGPVSVQEMKTHLSNVNNASSKLGLYKDLGSYTSKGGYSVFRDLLEKDATLDTISTIKSSGLRGMGGAGFPTGTKWEYVLKTSGSDKFVVCNADEGEPGTFKDRILLEQRPHTVLEGMLIAMLVVGATRGYIYLREEYVSAREILAHALNELKNGGLLGNNVMKSGKNFEVFLVTGAGAYICGEETAMLESIEGRRGEPRLKPPFPATHGLWQKPTLINNVETLALVPSILKNGVSWYKTQGRRGSSGSRIFSLSGDVKKPGFFELPLGTTVRELIYEYGGGVAEDKPVKAFVPGGVSTGLLPGSMIDTPLDGEAMSKAGAALGTGAIIVIAEGRCILDVVENCLAFFAHESCGKCTPCRVGSEKMLQMTRSLKQAEAPRDYLETMLELSEAMGLASICGLGQTAHLPFFTAFKHFREEIEAHLTKNCPAGICFPR